MTADFANDFEEKEIFDLASIAAAQKAGILKPACEDAAQRV